MLRLLAAIFSVWTDRDDDDESGPDPLASVIDEQAIAGWNAPVTAGGFGPTL